MKKLSLFSLVLLTACVTFTEQDATPVVLKRSAYDLSCGEEKIKITKLQEVSNLFGGVYGGTYGAEGCDKKMTYTVSKPDGDILVYKEGAEPSPTTAVIIPAQPYSPPAPIHHSIGKPYSGIGSFK